MGQVISIERVAKSSGSPASHFLGQDMKQAMVDELVRLKVAIGTGGELESVLALIVMRTEHSAEVVFGDAHGEVVSRSIPCQDGVLPGHYQSVPLGSIDTFLARDSKALNQLLQQDANLVHGRLTLARAVEAMSDGGLDARQALEQAVGAAHRCQNFERHVQASASEFTKWASAR